jgi:hypothetical protein
LPNNWFFGEGHLKKTPRIPPNDARWSQKFYVRRLLEDLISEMAIGVTLPEFRQNGKQAGGCCKMKNIEDPLPKVREPVSGTRPGSVELPDWQTDANTDTISEKVHKKQATRRISS